MRDVLYATPLCAAVIATPAAYAADSAQAQTAAPADDQTVVLEEVVVSAQKRLENAQSVPIAISAITGEALQERGVGDAGDIVKLFPGLSTKQNGSINNGLSIRGVGTQNFHLTAQQAVGQYQDEVSLVTPFTSQLGLFDMERVEVLRGPQNTLFGRNTTGGAVNYISRSPAVGKGLNGYARVRGGNLDRVDGEGALGVPLGDTFAARAAFSIQTRDGAFRNLVDGSDMGSIRRYGGRLGFAYQPSDATEVLLQGHVGYNRGSPTPAKAVGLFAADGVSRCPLLDSGVDAFLHANSCVMKTRTGALVNVSTADWNQVYNPGAAAADVDFEGALLNAHHDFSSFTLTSISGYDDTKVFYYQSPGGNPNLQFVTGQDGTYHVFSQEVRATSNQSGPLKWIAGAFYSHESDILGTIVRNNSSGPAKSVVPTVELDQKVEILSAYTQLDYAFTDKLSATAGVRWTQDNKDGLRTARTYHGTDTGLLTGTILPPDATPTLQFSRDIVANITTPCAAGVTPCNGPTVPLTQDLSKVGGKVGLNYHFLDDVMGYVSYSRGFKSGAFDVRAQGVFNGTGNTPVGPETLDAYEIGLKSTLLDRRLQLNATGFFYNWEGLQAFVTIPVVGPAFVNVPKSRLYGSELETQWALPRGWRIDASVSYLHTRVIDDGGYDSVTNGSRLANSPEWTAITNVTKTFALANDASISLAANGRYVGAQIGNFNEQKLGTIPAAFFLDLSAAYDFGPSGRYRATLWGENLTSEKTCFQLNSLDANTNTNACVPNEGTALYGVTLQMNF